LKKKITTSLQVVLQKPTTHLQFEKEDLRRGGTKASACFLTRAGARETPPHPYGMAQT